ncbi:hypothetical protein GCM10022281_22290 [Sphingomonas rosea]|uniref:Uncharacterized protein n=1 Tax=Sphingomonas rosea TaxID=335605 RepID=A0ABP7UDT7_9SPHN
MALSPIDSLADVPTARGVARLRASLIHDCEQGLVSPLRYDHRARVLRQQEALLANRSRR